MEYFSLFRYIRGLCLMKWPMTIKKMLHNVPYFCNTEKLYVRLSYFKIMAHLVTFWRVFLGHFIKHISEGCFLYFVCSSRLSYQLSTEIKQNKQFRYIVLFYIIIILFWAYLMSSWNIKSKSQKVRNTILESIYCSPFLLFPSVVTMLLYDYF